MDAFNDHLGTHVLATEPAHRSVPKRQYLRAWSGNTNVSPGTPARPPVVAVAAAKEPTNKPSATPSPIQRLEAGQAVKLRAKKLSVLRIAHGRAWVTLSEVGPYSRVLAGDHFLSRGESLTLLAGQELVMEPFGRGEKTSVQFSWGPPGAVAAVTQMQPAANWRGEVMQPLLDLRHAGGLAARAMGRLAPALGRAALAEVERVANYVAMIFVADGARKTRAKSTFDAVARDATPSCRL